LDGVAPISIALSLYKEAHFKRRIVAKELTNKIWMRSASHISTHQELIKFVKLWSLLKNVQLRGEVQDNITWKWEPSGE
jgi:hypothetical protein